MQKNVNYDHINGIVRSRENIVSLAKRLNPQPIDQAAVIAWARSVANKIRLSSAPDAIILFGSGAAGTFCEGSDLDLLLIYPDLQTLRQGRQNLRTVRPFGVPCPVDLIFVTKEHYDASKNLGGVCFVACHEGISL